MPTNRMNGRYEVVASDEDFDYDDDDYDDNDDDVDSDENAGKRIRKRKIRRRRILEEGSSSSSSKDRSKKMFLVIIAAVLSSLAMHQYDRSVILNEKPKEMMSNDNDNNAENKNEKIIDSNDDEEEEEEEASKWPRVAWLMSFPNSGTTYTGFLIMGITNTTTAANYGQECDVDENGHNVPVHPSYTEGPFYKDLYKLERPKSGYIMTKTHCGGRCIWCPPDNYIESHRSFFIRCAQGERMTPGGHLNSIGKPRETVVYDAKRIVHKAIHLIRDPFDNIVSRLHMYRKQNMKSRSDEMDLLYPDNAKGLRQFCHDIDTKFIKKTTNSRFIDDELIQLQSNVTCYNEIYKWVQWHNLAFATANSLNLPTYVLHYENYTYDFHTTVQQLLHFLNQTQVVHGTSIPKFQKGKHYRDYFPLSNLQATKRMVRELAMPETWKQVKHYFD